MLTGYMHYGYAESLKEFGIPRKLPHCGGWVLVRQIPSFPSHDAMGCYPLFSCPEWSQLHLDLECLKDELICLSLVTDPFGKYDISYLNQFFDIVTPFKEHFISDLTQPINNIISKHHRKCIRRSIHKVQVEKCSDPLQHLDEWIELYKNLINRHNIKGIKKFSSNSFAKQLDIPGIVMFRVLFQDKTVGANLFYVQENVAYGHLSAFSNQGYELGAAYAVKWASIQYFIEKKITWLNLGAGAGIGGQYADGLGLSDFKRGWSTGTKTAYFCGRIFDRERYLQLVNVKGITKSDYFPAYRMGEFE